MKKLNRKGFTLIELLAVIVILAIVLVVTIPSVIDTMNDARDRSLQNAADTVAEWYTKQYEIATLGASLGANTNDPKYTAFPVSTTSATFSATGGEDALEAAGISNAAKNIDLANSSVVLNTNGKVCVTLTAKSGGNFYVNDSDYDNKATTSGC